MTPTEKWKYKSSHKLPNVETDKTLRMYKIVEMQNIIAELNNSFDELNNKLDMAKERIK